MRTPCACGCGKFPAGKTAEYMIGHYPRDTSHKEMERRFRRRYEKRQEDECWCWKENKDRDGYGLFWDGCRQKQVRAHVFALETKLGRALRKGMQALHSCDNPSCVNPKHLWEGTNLDNVADRQKKNRQSRKGNGGGVWGNKLPHAKLNPNLVLKARRLYVIKKWTLKQITSLMSRKYGVHVGIDIIHNVVTHQTWKQVGGPKHVPRRRGVCNG